MCVRELELLFPVTASGIVVAHFWAWLPGAIVSGERGDVQGLPRTGTRRANSLPIGLSKGEGRLSGIY